MELIENLPLTDMSEDMAATIKSEMPQQPPPNGSAPDSEPATANPDTRVPSAGMLQQLYEQQQIFAYHAQQAQQAHMNCARLVRAAVTMPDAGPLPFQVQRLSELRAAMVSLQNDGIIAPVDHEPLPPSGGKRHADTELPQPDALVDTKRQRVEPDGGSRVAAKVGEDVPTYTEDVTGLGLPVLISEVRTRGLLVRGCMMFNYTCAVRAEWSIGVRPENTGAAHRVAKTGSYGTNIYRLG